MKFTEETEDKYPDPEVHGYDVSGFVTKKVDLNDTFGYATLQLVTKITDKKYEVPVILMTTRYHWSGYSEFTITNTWSEIILTVPAWNWEQEWPSLSAFLEALAEANPEKDQ